MMLVFRALKEPKYLGLAVVFGALIMALYAFLQVFAQGLNNFWFWFTVLTPWPRVLYLIYGVSFGATLSFIVWQRVKKVCPVSKTAKGGFFGAIGSFLGAAVPLCPACLTWVALLLPASLLSSLLKYNLAIMGASILLLFLALWLLGGFKKV